MLRQSERKTNMFCNLGTAYYSVCCNPGVAIILHTPRACSHLSLEGHWFVKRRAYLRDPALQLPVENHLFVTGITDKQAIFGGEELLRDCLLDVAELPWVKYMIVVAGCTAGVIGDDVEAVCSGVEEETGIPVLLVPGAGFMSKHHVETQIDLISLLLDRFSKPRKKDPAAPRTAVVFGENRGTANEHNIHEITRLLSYFGFQHVLFVPNAMSLSDFARVPDASLFMAVGFSFDHFDRMQQFTEEMAKRYEAPCYLGNYPIGEDGTFHFLTEMGRLLGMEKEAESAVLAEKKDIAESLVAGEKELRGKHFLCVLGFPLRFCRIENHLHALSRAGLVLDAIILHNDLTGKEKQEQVAHIRAFPEWQEVPILDGERHVEAWRGKVDMVLSTTVLVDVPHQLCISVQQVGTMGVKHLLTKVEATLKGSGRRITYEF